jgi:hypothetical protein
MVLLMSGHFTVGRIDERVGMESRVLIAVEFIGETFDCVLRWFILVWIATSLGFSVAG